MAKISLRMYNREIDNLISRGQTDEAVDHCKYILKQFPKHIDTYRSLGKAFLESQRFTEATDILQRVLSVFPDDYYSQIGMSVIREDEGNLDAAIWHMERAYEVKTSNKTIQDELRRLYGKRDGLEPPKLRNTRGSLVRLYEKGGLYSQAIAEARAALAEDPKRVDLEIILARSYQQSGEYPEAIDACNRLVKRLPFCYEANRILSEILPTTARAEDAKVFQQNLNALNPYAAFTSPAAPNPDQVADTAVMLEKLDWQPAPVSESQPEWSRSVGVQLQDAGESAPDWLAPAAAAITLDHIIRPTPTEEKESEAETPSLVDQLKVEEEELIPEWMKAAGWQSSTGAVDESTLTDQGSETFPALGEETQAEGDITPGDMPDWLKEIAPPPALTGEVEDEASLEQLKNLLPPQQGEEKTMSPIIPAVASVAAIDWLRGMKEPENTDTDEQGVSQADQEETAASVPVAADEIKQSETQEIVSQPVVQGESDANEIPDWLSDLEKESGTPPGETPAWVPSVDTEKTVPGPELGGKTGESAEGGFKIPSAALGAAAAVAVSQILSSNEDKENIPAAESDLAETAMPPSAEIVAPDQAEQMIDSEVESGTIDQTENIISRPEGTISAEESSPAGIPASEDMDAALAWLEMLAAKQGVEEATLTTAPENRLDSPPEWLQSDENVETPTAESEIPALESGGPSILAAALGGAAIASALQSHESTPSESNQEIPATISESLEQPIKPEAESETPALESGGPSILAAALGGAAVAAALQSHESTPSESNQEIPATSSEGLEPPIKPEVLSEMPIGPDTTPEIPMDEGDMDQAFAWLESLAARQGADEDTFMIKPEERSFTPPEWVLQPETEPAMSEGQEILPETAHEQTVQEPSTAKTDFEEDGGLGKLAAAALVTGLVVDSYENDATTAAAEVSAPEPEMLSEEPPFSGVAGEQISTAEEPRQEDQTITAVEETQPGDEIPAVEPELVLEEPSVETTSWVEEVVEGTAAETPAVIAMLPHKEQPLPEGITTPSVSAGVEGSSTEIYQSAKSALNEGQISTALEGYQELIKNGNELDQVILDLNEAVYRYPVDINILQTLGDAYLRSDRLQDALDTYTKAEELLR